MPDTTGQYRLEDLKQRWGRDPSSRLFLQLADEHRKLGQHAEAVAVLEQGLEHRPHDLSALVALGRCRLELEQAGDAVAPLEEVISRDPTHIVANKLLVEAHLQRGDADQAGRYLETYRLLNDRDPELDHLAYRLERLTSESGGEATASVVETPESEAEVEAGDEAPLEAVEGEVEPPVEAGAAEDDAVFEVEAAAEDDAALDVEADVESPLETEASDTEALVGGGGGSAEAAERAPGDKAPVSATADEAVDGAVEDVEIIDPGDEPDPSRVPPVFVSDAADPFLLADELAPASSPGELWRPPPPPEPGFDEPFSGLRGMDAARHWHLLTEEGIFGAGGRGGSEGAETAEPEGITEAETPTDAWPPLANDGTRQPGDEATLDSEAPGSAGESEATPATGMAAAAVGAAAGAAAILGSREHEESEAEPHEIGPEEAQPSEAAAVAAAPAEEPVEGIEETPAVRLPAGEPEEEEAATATLGELYLKQGHRREAERIFRRVLERDPQNARALAGLERLGRREEKPGRPLTAQDLLAVRSATGRIPEGLTAKKILVLGNYVKHLRTAEDTRRHVQ